MRYHFTIVALAASVVATPTTAKNTTVVAPVTNTTCNGKSYIYQNLAGYGYVPYNTVDSKKDTIGGIGSSASIEKKSWKKTGKDKYSGLLWGLPGKHTFG
jgi:hypothetical protein